MKLASQLLLPLGGWWAPSFSGQAPKKSISCPHHHNISGPKGGGGVYAGGPSSHRPLWGHHWCLRNLSTHDGTVGETMHPLPHPSTHTSCQIPSSELNWRAAAKCTSTSGQKSYLQQGCYGFPLPSGASRDPSILSPIWDELFRSLEDPSPWQRDP